MEFQIERGEWFINMGIVGFLRIAKQANLIGNGVYIDKHKIRFESEILNDFHEHYMNHFLTRYDIAKREKRKLDNHIKYAASEKYFKNNYNGIKIVMQQNYSKLKDKLEDPKYESEMKSILENVKELNKFEQFENLNKEVEAFNDLMKKEIVNHKFSMNYTRSVLSSCYFGQASFLQKAYARSSVIEQSKILYKDYVLPIMEEGKLMNCLESIDDIVKLLEFIEVEITNKAISKWYASVLKSLKSLAKKSSNMQEFRSKMQGMDYCVITRRYISAGDFEEKYFLPLGVSGDNAVNFFWNGNVKLPISNIVRLILLCAPAGTSDKRDGFYTFVNTNEIIIKLLKSNDQFNKEDVDEVYSTFMYNKFDEKEIKANYYLDGISFVEFIADGEAKKSIVKHYSISRKTAEFIIIDGKKYVKPMNGKVFKNKVIKCIMMNIGLKNIMIDELRECIKYGSGYTWDVKLACETKYILQDRRDEMDNQGKTLVESAYSSGWAIKSKFGTEDTSIKKIKGIAYRLLNAVKVGNKKEFYDSVLRICMSTDFNMPKALVDVMDQSEAFDSVAIAFIAGLLGQNNTKEVKVNE